MTEIFHQRLGKIVLLTEFFRYKIRVERRKLDFSRVFTLYGSFSLTFRYSSFLRDASDARDKKAPVLFPVCCFIVVFTVQLRKKCGHFYRCSCVCISIKNNNVNNLQLVNYADSLSVLFVYLFIESFSNEVL